MFLSDSGVFDGHLPPGELDHPSARRDVPGM
jgi:hypothetical protein